MKNFLVVFLFLVLIIGVPALLFTDAMARLRASHTKNTNPIVDFTTRTLLLLSFIVGGFILLLWWVFKDL